VRAKAKEAGYADCLYLDPKTHTYIDEIGGTNFFGITGDNRFITPDSATILPSITRRSVAEIAARYLGMTVEERLVPIAEIPDFVEAGACGTASVITPIGGIFYQGSLHTFYRDGKEAGPVTRRLYDVLTAIQCGDHEAPEGWIFEVSE
jgi:branched-chain amino acid aminotransferase